MAAPNRELEPTNLRLRKSELAPAWADVSHALRGFYELADILIVLDEVLLLEISNLARQLKFSLVIGDDHPIISHLTASLWFRGMDLTITSSTSKPRGPSNERKNVAAAEKQLEAMVYRLTQERGWWPFLTPRLENATDKTRESAPPLVKQIWEFLEEQLEVAESREMTVGRFVLLTPRLENATDKTRESAPPLVKQTWEFFEEQLEVAESRDMTVGRSESTNGGLTRDPENPRVEKELQVGKTRARGDTREGNLARNHS